VLNEYRKELERTGAPPPEVGNRVLGKKQAGEGEKEKYVPPADDE